MSDSDKTKRDFATSFDVKPDPDLSPVKAFDRAELVTPDDGSGRALFDVERHRAVLGAEYVAGSPMSAFETYWMRFAFDPATGVREELPQARPSIYTVVPESLANEWARDYSFSFEPDGKGCWEGHESLCGESDTVCSEAEAGAFGRAAARPVDVLDYFEVVLGEEVATGLLREAEEVREPLEDLLAAAAIEAWQRADDGLL